MTRDGDEKLSFTTPLHLREGVAQSVPQCGYEYCKTASVV